MRAIVLDGETRAALATVRSLGRAGIPVTLGTAGRGALAAASRYVDAHLALPDPNREPARYAERLIEAATSAGDAVWFPITDASLTVVDEIRDELEGARLPIPPREALAVAWDKSRVLEAAEPLGIRGPRTARPRNLDELRAAARDFEFPVILKPRRSRMRGADGTLHTGTVRAVHDVASLVSSWQEIHERIPLPIVQESIPGSGMGVFLLAEEGRVLARFAHRRIREKPPAGGVSVLRESVGVPASLEQAADRLMAALSWHGVCMVEFRVDARDGTPYLMEINPRLWGSLQLAVDAGVDFPVLLYRLALGESPSDPVPYRLGVRSRWLLGDVDHLLGRLRGRDGGALPPDAPGRLGALLRFLDPFAGRLEVIWLSDPGPGARELGQYLRALWRRLWSRRGR